MSEEEQTVAIAEACPDVAYMNEEGDWCWKNYPIRKYFTPLTDMNAVREAQKTLGGIRIRIFLNKLIDLNGDGTCKGIFEDANPLALWRLANADCAKCCHAFLYAIGKWKGQL
jgi:hypothetical protein